MLNVNNTLLAGGKYKGGLSWNKSATSIDQCFKLYYITRGEALINSENKFYKLEAGNYYFINGFLITNQCCPVSFEVNWLHFITDSIFLKQFLRKLPAVVPISNEFLLGSETVFNSFTHFFDKSSEDRKKRTNEFYSTYLKIQSLLLMVVSNLIHNLKSDLLNPENTETRLMPAIEYINRSYKKGITLKKLSNICFLSENYFHNLFKRSFGVTPNNYILQLKMNEAVNLLSNTNMSVKEIASEIGYYDVAYFTRSFSKYFEISPGRFRKSSEKRIP
ncbi:MAG: helix-turn-helix transcriptional regulator [Bacteroidetes bacterium]|nr:helix-turn-helix transcriptional regulator [Bacteroidota bacterium]